MGAPGFAYGPLSSRLCTLRPALAAQPQPQCGTRGAAHRHRPGPRPPDLRPPIPSPRAFPTQEALFSLWSQVVGVRLCWGLTAPPKYTLEFQSIVGNEEGHVCRQDLLNKAVKVGPQPWAVASEEQKGPELS